MAGLTKNQMAENGNNANLNWEKPGGPCDIVNLGSFVDIATKFYVEPLIKHSQTLSMETIKKLEELKEKASFAIYTLSSGIASMAMIIQEGYVGGKTNENFSDLIEQMGGMIYHLQYLQDSINDALIKKGGAR